MGTNISGKCQHVGDTMEDIFVHTIATKMSEKYQIVRKEGVPKFVIEIHVIKYRQTQTCKKTAYKCGVVAGSYRRSNSEMSTGGLWLHRNQP